MPIVKINRSIQKDNLGVLGKAVLEAGVIHNVYKASSIAKVVNININVANTSQSTANVIVWISKNDTPTLVDVLEPLVRIAKDCAFVRTNIVMGKDESIFIKSDVSDCVVRIDGYENNPL
jgi:hypothetical protein